MKKDNNGKEGDDMCTDPEAAKELAVIKTEIRTLNGRVDALERLINGDGEREKGILPRLAAIETKINLLVWLLGAGVTALLPVAAKYLIGG